jgi:hypothetical protein
MPKFVKKRPGTSRPLANPVAERYELLPWGAIRVCAEVFTEGLKTHDEDGWRRLPREEHINRALRHLALYSAGDTSEDHLKHAACRCLMAIS